MGLIRTASSARKKTSPTHTQVDPIVNALTASADMVVSLEAFCEAEMDEQWSYVGKKSACGIRLIMRLDDTGVCL